VADERTTGGTDSLPPPARRDADDDKGRRSDDRNKRLFRWLGEERLGFDPDDTLHRQRGIGKKTACVALAATRIRLRADEPKRSVHGKRQAGGEFKRRPVVLAASERHEHTLSVPELDPRVREDSDVRGRALEECDEALRQPVRAEPGWSIE